MGCIYKLLAKVLARRMAEVLGQVIGGVGKSWMQLRRQLVI